MSKNSITVQEEQELFDKGVVIRRAWIMPDRKWEYYASPVGDLKNTIAIKSTSRAAYNAISPLPAPSSKNDLFFNESVAIYRSNNRVLKKKPG